ncbi:MAG: hypothetical protein ACYCT9_09715 [Leptospirillum sp.]
MENLLFQWFGELVMIAFAGEVLIVEIFGRLDGMDSGESWRK